MRRRFPTLSMSAAVGLSLLAGCGRSAHHQTVRAASAPVAVGGDAAAPATASAPHQKIVVVPRTQSSAIPAVPAPQPSPSAGNAGATATTVPGPVAVSADRACVHPGDTQGVTVRGESNGSIVFDTVYADHTDNLTSKYGSGSGSGKADGSGLFHVTWTIAPNVPTGTATINVGATYQRDVARGATTFVVKPAGETC